MSDETENKDLEMNLADAQNVENTSENIAEDQAALTNDIEEVKQDSSVNAVESNLDKESISETISTTVEEELSSAKKKQKSPFARFILGLIKAILWILLVLVIAIAGWLAFSAFNKKAPISAVPEDFALFVKAESVWDVVEPMLDLQAADILLSDQSFAGARSAFMTLRSSKFRNNPVVSFLGQRELDGAIYLDSQKNYGFVVVLELGVLSSASRLAPFAQRFLNIENLNYFEAGHYFTFDVNETMKLYLKPDHDLVIVASSQELFDKAINTEKNYSSSAKSTLTKKDGEKVKLFVDTEKLVSLYESDNAIVSKLSEILDYDSFSKLGLDITDKQIKLKITVPYKDGFAVTDKYPIIKASTVPQLVSKFPHAVQYYTMLNVGSLEDLKTTVFPFVPAKYNIESLWATGSSLAKSILGASLEDILFSWTGNEICAFGIEGQNDPIFAIQIKDEKQRRQVFDNVLSSLLLKDDNSLILDGVRIPRMMLPSYIQNILDVFGINLQMPYYIVDNGYVFFSASAECLSNFHLSCRYMEPLYKNNNYEKVAKGLDSNVLLSLYYNLDRAVPFFIRKNASISRVLELYSLGRFDVSLRNGNLLINLQANSEKVVKFRDVPGFPMELSGRNDGYLYVENTKNPGAMFWVQDGNVLNAMELPSRKINSVEINEKISLCSMEKTEKNGNVIWAVTESGDVYLYDKKLAIADGFPVVTGCSIVDKPVAYDKSIVFATTDGKLCMVKSDTSIKVANLPVTNGLFSAPTVLKEEKAFVVYDKGFLGKIITVNEKDFKPKKEFGETEEEVEEDVVLNPQTVAVAGIGFGNAATCKIKGNVYTAFVTQAGMFYLWCNGEVVENFPLKLEGVYNVNCVALEGCFYLLSEDAILTRVTTDGDVLSVKIPYGKGKTPFMSIVQGNIYVCADSNTIYAFTKDMEMLYGFPVTGWGVPIYADVNGDNQQDCFALGLDGRMYCWNVN